MRRIVSAVVFLVCLCSVVSAGTIPGNKTLSVISTDYFDIIFPPESIRTARSIAGCADDFYREICALLTTEPRERFPVTIKSSSDSLNGYFSPVPYNRIVLYDAPPSSSLDMYDDTMRSVFYHELTHAVTFSLKSPFWQGISAVFGDTLNPAWLSLTTFWEEGATVSFESAGSGGRLNDPFSTQLIAQAKIENCFPSWRDVTGARDTYPGGTDAYLFGAAFARYLQQTYGMEKYGRFWKNAGSVITPSFSAGVFKRTYGKTVDEVWKDFRDSYEIPAVVPAVPENGVTGFFTPSSNAQKPVFRSLSVSRTGIVWYDYRSSAVWYVPLNDQTGSYGTACRLLSVTGVTSLALSSDGSSLAISRLIDQSAERAEVAVCVLKNSGTDHTKAGRLYFVPEKRIRDACLIAGSPDTGTYLAAVNSDQRPVSMTLYRCTPGKPDFTAVHKIVFEDGVVPFCLQDAGGGRIACICKSKLTWTIRIYNQELTSYREWNPSAGLSETYILHNLHVCFQSESRLLFTFTWAALGKSGTMLPRSGFFSVSPSFADGTGTFSLQQDDVSGGVTDAVALTPFQLVYSASFYDTTQLFIMNAADRLYQQESVLSVVHETGTVPLESADSELPAARPYRAKEYYKRGIMAPFGIVPVYNHDFTLSGYGLLGATYVSSNPWGNSIILMSGGYDSISRCGGALLTLAGNTDTFSGTVQSTALFDSHGFLQSEQAFSVSNVLYSGAVNSITLAADGAALCGDDSEGTGGCTAESTGSVSFSTVHRAASGYMQYRGVYVTPFISSCYDDGWSLSPGVTAGVRIPGFFPLTFYTTTEPLASYFLSQTVSSVFYVKEIQKGIPVVSLYVDRFVLSGAGTGYAGGNPERGIGSMDFYGRCSLTAQFITSINTGEFATSSLRFTISGELVYYIYENSSDNRIRAGLGGILVY